MTTIKINEQIAFLRKQKGLTQEELAQTLFVSRTAISKWESGRGYPSIDSLKEISSYFSVTIDDLLSGEKLLSIAEKENKSNIRKMCHMLFGVLDACVLILIVLPLYPNRVDGYVYSVNLFAYSQTTPLNLLLYWNVFLSLGGVGIVGLLFTKLDIQKGNQIMTGVSMVLSISLVLFLAITREAYALIVVFLLLVLKGMLLYRCMKG